MSSAEESKLRKYTAEEVAYRDGGITLKKLSKEEEKLQGAADPDSKKRIAEIANEKKKYTKDTWIILHGLVYDVTQFLTNHPGGPESILQRAGKDATIEFEDIFHGPSAREQLRPLLVGRLDTFDGPEDLVYKVASGGGSNAMITAAVPIIIAIIAVIFYFFSQKK